MTAIEATSYTMRTLVDGTLAVTLHIEPRFAADAFRLLGAPGQPVALAALRAQAQREEAQASTPAPAERAPRNQTWSQWLALRCGEPQFLSWLAERFAPQYRAVAIAVPGFAPTNEMAAEICRRILDVKSRAEIDSDPEAQERFQRLIRGPWSAHYQARNG